jgi:hypothetical protein
MTIFHATTIDAQMLMITIELVRYNVTNTLVDGG